MAEETRTTLRHGVGEGGADESADELALEPPPPPAAHPLRPEIREMLQDI